MINNSDKLYYNKYLKYKYKYLNAGGGTEQDILNKQSDIRRQNFQFISNFLLKFVDPLTNFDQFLIEIQTALSEIIPNDPNISTFIDELKSVDASERYKHVKTIYIKLMKLIIDSTFLDRPSYTGNYKSGEKNYSDYTTLRQINQDIKYDTKKYYNSTTKKYLGYLLLKVVPIDSSGTIIPGQSFFIFEYEKLKGIDLDSDFMDVAVYQFETSPPSVTPLPPSVTPLQNSANALPMRQLDNNPLWGLLS